mgnify:FL=1
MNNNSSNKTGISFWTKDEYARKYFTRRPIRHQRCIGVTTDMLEGIKDVVNLIAMGGTTVRAYVSAVIADHLQEYKFLHEYMRRAMYNKILVGDLEKYQPSYEKYDADYLRPSTESRNEAWVHLDADCADALKQIVAWTGDGVTIGSFAEAIIKAHFAKNKELLESMKSDVFNCQP